MVIKHENHLLTKSIFRSSFHLKLISETKQQTEQ